DRHARSRARHRGRLDEEPDIQPGGVIALEQIGDVQRIGLAGRDRVAADPGGERLQRGQVLDLLYGEDVRHPQVVTDGERRLVEAAVKGGGRQDGLPDGGVVDGVKEAVEVVGGHRELAGGGRGDGGGGGAAGDREPAAGLGKDREVPGGVVQRAD